jgi:hypothetical protein
MKLGRAIEKAGPGGKGENAVSGWEFEITKLGNVVFKTKGREKKGIPLEAALSDYWEVVEPEQIEVGDVVRMSTMGKKWIVENLGMSYETCEEGLTPVACVSNGETIRLAPLHLLTLIRKGPKKLIYPQVELREIRFMSFRGADEDKEYKLTLEEME